MSVRFFYDSYAVLAYTSGHEGYRGYFEEHDGVLTKLNLLEVYHRSLEQHGPRAASEILNTFSKYLVDFGLGDISGAMKVRLRLKRERRDLCYSDALGYFLSQKLGIKFLTGNRAFRSLGGVEYLE